jgi:hypothetical protein
MVLNVTSGALEETRFIAPNEMNASINSKDINKMNRDLINRVFTIKEGNCSGICVNVSLGNTGIIAKLLNCAFFKR